MASFSKHTALLLFCCFREAERSIHYALSSPSQWPQFLAYYDQAKQDRISSVLALLQDAGAGKTCGMRRQEFREHGFLLSLVRVTLAAICNPLKRSWSFSSRELSFYHSTLEYLLGILQNTELPEKGELIELRRDCFHCHYRIATKLFGLPELRKADSIEHFFHSSFVKHFTFKDLGS